MWISHALSRVPLGMRPHIKVRCDLLGLTPGLGLPVPCTVGQGVLLNVHLKACKKTTPASCCPRMDHLCIKLPPYGPPLPPE